MKKTKKELIKAVLPKLENLSHYTLSQMYKELFPCNHENIEIKNESAICVCCEEYMGHGCSKSPDKLCHYYSEEKDGKKFILLRNGESHILPDNYDSGYETEDDCIFCHLPDERK